MLYSTHTLNKNLKLQSNIRAITMQLSIQELNIEIFSESLDQIEKKYGFQLNGAIIEPEQLILEFQTCIDDEDIVFDVYYDQNSHFEKIHVDEDYERTFHEHFHSTQFSDSHIRFN